jgi:hypothetical protein
MKLLAIFSAALLICICTTTSSAKIYSWVDENGITHFTNYSPPPGARIVVKDIPVSQRTLPDKESVEKGDLLGEGPDLGQDLKEDKILAKRKKDEALEEKPYSSESYYPNAGDSDGSKNRYASKYPPGFHRYPPELHLLRHHPNYHYKYHLDKPHAKKQHSAYRHKRHYNKPTIWDRDLRLSQKRHAGSHRKRVFGWQPPKAKGRPSAHYFAFGGGHYRGTSISTKGRFGGRASAFTGKGRSRGRGSAFGGRGRSGGGRSGR